MKKKVIKVRTIFNTEMTFVLSKKLNKKNTNPAYLKWEEEIKENLRIVEKKLRDSGLL